MFAHRPYFDQIECLADKGFYQHPPRLLSADAAGSQVKKRRLVEIADRGPMAAFDVVGKDLELGLGVDRRAGAQHQVAAELVRIDLLSAGTDRDPPLKGTVPMPGGDPLEHFAGVTARC